MSKVRRKWFKKWSTDDVDLNFDKVLESDIFLQWVESVIHNERLGGRMKRRLPPFEGKF